MNQLIEFIGNHPILSVAFIGTLGLLIFTEYERFSSGVKNITPFAATQMLNEGNTVFLDIRGDADYKKGHVIDAHNLPVSNMDQHIHEIEKLKDKEIVVYCDTGMRSPKAASKLKKNGFEKIHNLAGGLAAWEKASLPLVTK